MEKHYFEFNKHEYYGLVTVSVDENETNLVEKATEIYVRDIASITVEEALKEGMPVKRTKEYAFTTFAEAPDNEDESFKTLIKQFNELENEVVLIDGSLV